MIYIFEKSLYNFNRNQSEFFHSYDSYMVIFLHTLLCITLCNSAFNNFLLIFGFVSNFLKSQSFIVHAIHRFYFQCLKLDVISIKSSLIYYNNITVRFVRLVCLEAKFRVVVTFLFIS